MKNRCLLLLIMGVLIGGCANLNQRTRPPLSDQQLQRLNELEQWQISARLGLSDGDQSGSGRFEWSQRSTETKMQFYGAFGQGSWRLSVTPRVARLELAADEVYTAANIEQLLSRTIGWDIPVEALGWWVRGLPAPGGRATFLQDSSDQLERLEQFGWTVEFTAFTEVDGLTLPRKMTARRGADQLKLVIQRWHLPPAV